MPRRERIKMSYKSSGVDINAADKWVEEIQSRVSQGDSQKLVSGVGEYAAVYAQNENEWLATSCDGIGTKIFWTLEGLKASENPEKDLAQDLLSMNVNDLLCTGATPKLFLDYIACSGSDALQEGRFLKKFIRGLIDICRDENQILAGGETAQMPDLYKDDHFDVGGFSIGFLKPEEYLHPKNITEGSQVWGWTSNGPHSNGFSWLRKIFDNQKDKELIQKELMPPTRVYIKDFLNLRKNLQEKGFEKSLQAAFHITGSGLWNLLRSQKNFGFELSNWPELPHWVKAVQERTKCSTHDLFATFNCGIGFAVVVDQNVPAELLKDLRLVELGKTIKGNSVILPKFQIEIKE